jgi:hypothetical protein
MLYPILSEVITSSKEDITIPSQCNVVPPVASWLDISFINPTVSLVVEWGLSGT